MGFFFAQGSFVICKLIRKHDEKVEEKQEENTEASNCDEVEQTVSSPGTAEKLSPTGESCVAETSDTPLPSEWPNSFIADDGGYKSIVRRANFN